MPMQMSPLWKEHNGILCALYPLIKLICSTPTPYSVQIALPSYTSINHTSQKISTMSTTSTTTVTLLKENTTESPSITLTAAPSPITRSNPTLTETKHEILTNISDALKKDIKLIRRQRAPLKANISDALKQDIELTRRKQAVLKDQNHTDVTKAVPTEKINTSPPHQPTSPSQPASELSQQPPYRASRPRIERSDPLHLKLTLSPSRFYTHLPHLKTSPAPTRTVQNKKPKMRFPINPVIGRETANSRADVE